MAQFGRLDILFNNAGIVFNGNLVECTEEEWNKTLDVNLKSMYLLCRNAVPVMQRQGGGSIINMASVAGPTGVGNRGAYSVSKAGVIGLTKSLAMDFVKDGIRVNCICPGTVDTPSLRQRIATAPDPEAAPPGLRGAPADGSAGLARGDRRDGPVHGVRRRALHDGPGCVHGRGDEAVAGAVR